MMIGTVRRTRMRRGRGKNEKRPYKESESNMTEPLVSTVVTCSNRSMRLKSPKGIHPATIGHPSLESSLPG